MIGWNSRGTMRVLVVEDEIKMADALARGLRRVGYAVDLAQDGEEAIGHASVYDYDAIVLDVMLPGQDGFQVRRELEQPFGRPLIRTVRGVGYSLEPE